VQMSVPAQPDNHGRRVLSGAMSAGIASSTEAIPSIGWTARPSPDRSMRPEIDQALEAVLGQ
jgi:hypothetical protein